MAILVTGGAGYIGSHAVQRLLRDGHRVVAVDNLFRGHREAIDRLTASAVGRLSFVPADVCDRAAMARVMVEHGVDAVMHFAALAYVGESVDKPLMYHRNNVGGTIALLEACAESREAGGPGVDRLVFSSTCATYGEPGQGFIPIPESCPQRPINPYGWSKLHCERVLLDYADAESRAGRPFAVAALRYFNVAGCDRGGLLGEHHLPETHLIPAAIQAVLGTREHFGASGGLTLFGTDYATRDGTCVRDYVHVEDLVDAHAAVMKSLEPRGNPPMRCFNLGIGRGYSVREIIESVERVSGRKVPVTEGPRRAGDPPELFANPEKIRRDIGWSAGIVDLDEIVRSAWAWMARHPHGYQTKQASANGASQVAGMNGRAVRTIRS